jgi:hypothetical protein
VRGHSEPASELGDPGRERVRQRRRQLARDDREIERQAVSREGVDKGEQAVVVPAGIVVAEEDVDGPGRLVEGPPEWLEPIVHGADGPTRRRMVISSIL